MAKEFIGQYKIVGELGRGGMGVVYKGYDESLDRNVAIKVLSDALSANAEVVERFKREAKAMGALNDPHIIQVYFIGDEGGNPFFVMEFVEGESLSDRMKREGKLSVAEARRILQQTAEGLATAHGRGMVHRDIKPGNLMLDKSGRVKIADFGIAMTHDFGDRLTRTGEFVGTPGYLSPEVCMGHEIDARSDIFALGVVFFEMLTGRLPFTETSPLGLMLEVVKAEIPDVRKLNENVDANTYRVLSHMLAKERDDRYKDCNALVQAMDAQTASEPHLRSSGQEAATIITGPGATVAMPTPPPQPASPPRSTSLVAARPEKKSSNRAAVLISAVAALLVLSVGGSLYAFRAQLFGDDTGAGQKINTVRTAADAEPGPSTTASETSDSIAGNRDVGGTEAGVTEISDEELVADMLKAVANDSPDGPDEASLASSVDPEKAHMPPGSALPTSNRTPVASDGAIQSGELEVRASAEHGKDTRPVAYQPSADEAALTKTHTDSESAAITATSGPNRSEVDSRAAQVESAETAPVQMAKVTTPPRQSTVKRVPVTPTPDPDRILVLSSGDRSIAREVEQLLSQRLMRENLEILDTAFISGLDRVVGPDGVDLVAARELALREGVGTLIIADAQYMGETPLEYYGQYDTLYTVDLEVKAVDLVNRKTIPGGWREQVRFTSLNAAEQARLAVEPHMDALASMLRDRS